jgi:hypothetical protein
MKKHLYINLILGLLIFVVPAYTQDEQDEAKEREYGLKAVYIYNFTKYITWPDSGNRKTFTIAVMGDSPVFNSLKRIAGKKLVNNKKIVLIHITSKELIRESDILFIPNTYKGDICEILNRIKDYHTLSICESKGVCEQGIGVNLFIDEGRIKFELNQKAIQKAGLNISSHLLKLAIIVE